MDNEPSSNLSTPRCAIVTGANKGIGFEICEKLVENGVMVVMTARDEKRGLEALQNLKASSHVDDDDSLVIFHQLDVADPASVASLFDFVNTRFGKLDILINNAGISGLEIEGDELVLSQTLEQGVQRQLARSSNINPDEEKFQIKANGRIVETYELAQECIQINYNGAKRMIGAFLPLLRLSDSPRIVNVSSSMGLLKFLSNEWAISVLDNIESLTEERVDEVINEFLKDFKEGSLKAKNWPSQFSAYKISKAAMNAYTRIIAKTYPSLYVNSVCPGYVKTDMTRNSGRLSVGEGAESIVKLALLPQGEEPKPSGLFYQRQQISSF